MKKLFFVVLLLSGIVTGADANTLLKGNYTAAGTLSDSMTLECNGYSMTAQGKKICQYLDKIDSKTRFVYAAIEKDTIVYTVFRKNKDNSIDMLKKWKIYIGLVNNASPYFGVFHWMNGPDKISKITLPIISGQKYYWEENFCKPGGSPQRVVSGNNMDLSFSDEAEARAFFDQVKQIRSTITTAPVAGGPSTKPADKNLAGGRLKIVNKSAGAVFIKVEGSGSTNKIQPNSAYDINCQMYQGRKVWLTKENSQVLQVLFTVNEQICKDGEYVIGK